MREKEKSMYNFSSLVWKVCFEVFISSHLIRLLPFAFYHLHNTVVKVPRVPSISSETECMCSIYASLCKIKTKS